MIISFSVENWMSFRDPTTFFDGCQPRSVSMENAFQSSESTKREFFRLRRFMAAMPRARLIFLRL